MVHLSLGVHTFIYRVGSRIKRCIRDDNLTKVQI